MTRRPFVAVPLPVENRRNKPVPPEDVPENVRLHLRVRGNAGYTSDRQLCEKAVIPQRALRRGLRGEPFAHTYAQRYAMALKIANPAITEHIFPTIKRDHEMPDEDDSEPADEGERDAS